MRFVLAMGHVSLSISKQLELNTPAGQNFMNIDINVHLFIKGCWFNVPRGHSGLDNFDEPD